MDFRKYFEDAQDDANENFFNADGWESEYDDFDGDYNFEGDSDEEFDMAVGRASAPTSQPYIVSIQNTLTATDLPCTILTAYETLNYSAPNWQNAAGISITMNISGVTYNQFLYQSMNKPFVVGQTYYQSSNANQVLEPITIIQKDVNGNESQKTIVPTIDPYQQQNTMVVIRFQYRIDGFTAIVLSSVLAATTVKVYLYPAETVSTSRTLVGRKAVRGYGDPRIVKGDTLKLSKSSIAALKGRG